MNQMSSRNRKFLYMGAIILLLFPICLSGNARNGSAGESGGTIAQQRQTYKLGEATLGDVDPTSATMNLVLLGMRGIAGSVLWTQADEEKRTKNWSALESTVESLIKLQPRFMGVWKFQGWNLGLQRLGRMRRRRGPLLLGEERSQVPVARHQAERRRRRAVLQHGRIHGQEDRPLRRAGRSSASSSSRTRTPVSRDWPTPNSTATSRTTISSPKTTTSTPMRKKSCPASSSTSWHGRCFALIRGARRWTMPVRSNPKGLSAKSHAKPGSRQQRMAREVRPRTLHDARR